MTRRRNALAAALLVGTFAPPARADTPWDTTSSMVTPAVQLSSALHDTRVPHSLALCHPVGKTCPSAGAIDGFPGGRAVTTGYGITIAPLSFGPVSVGAELGFSWGKGPSARVSSTQVVSGTWILANPTFVVGLRLRRGAWRGSVELLPGFLGIQASVAGRGPDNRALSATASTVALGARTSLGIALRPWFTAAIYAGAAGGAFTDVNGGLRVDFHAPSR